MHRVAGHRAAAQRAAAVAAEAAGGAASPAPTASPSSPTVASRATRTARHRAEHLSFLADYDAPGEAAAEAGGSSRATCDGGGPSGATAAADGGGVLAGVCATLDSGAPLPSLREQAASVAPSGSWDFSGYASSINADAERRSGDDVDAAALEASAGAVPSRRDNRSVSFVPVTVDADDGTRRATR